MNWHQNAAMVDRLAAGYVLGTLRGAARRRFATLLPHKTALRMAVDDWTLRLSPLLTTLPPLEPSRALWRAVAQRTVGPVAGDRHSQSRPLWRRIFSGIPAGALAMGVMVGVMAPALWNTQQPDGAPAQLPASYVGVLATADGKPGLIVSSLRQGMLVDIKQVAPVAVPQGMRLYLWRIDAEGKVKPLGPLPGGKWVQMPLADAAEKIFSQAVELAVSVERVDNDSPQTPALPFVYRGLCGKLWK